MAEYRGEGRYEESPGWGRKHGNYEPSNCRWITVDMKKAPDGDGNFFGIAYLSILLVFP